MKLDCGKAWRCAKANLLADGAQFSRELRTAYMEPEMDKFARSRARRSLRRLNISIHARPTPAFSPPEAAIQMHAGDWHNAMQTYSDRAHKVWKWQPWPNKTRDVWNIQSAGWGQSPLFKDGKWRTDVLQKETDDVIEIMSWWQWSKKGPWQVPMGSTCRRAGRRHVQSLQKLLGNKCRDGSTGISTQSRRLRNTIPIGADCPRYALIWIRFAPPESNRGFTPIRFWPMITPNSGINTGRNME